MGTDIKHRDASAAAQPDPPARPPVAAAIMALANCSEFALGAPFLFAGFSQVADRVVLANLQ
jgi:hypothetical protein